MRKLLCGLLLVVLCFVSGCSMDEDETDVKSVGEQAFELEQKAEDAVEEMNKDTTKLDETAKILENAFEE